MRKIRSFRIQSLWKFQGDGVETTISLKQPLVPLAFLIAFIYYIIAQTGIMAMATAALGSVLLISYLWARSMALNISAERRLRYTAFQVGDEFEEHITLNNRSSCPSYGLSSPIIPISPATMSHPCAQLAATAPSNGAPAPSANSAAASCWVHGNFPLARCSAFSRSTSAILTAKRSSFTRPWRPCHPNCCRTPAR
jgi:hypothetical protein